jgi:hypothetical protein
MTTKLDIIIALHKKSTKVLEGPTLAGFFADAKKQLPELSSIIFKYESKQVLPKQALDMLKQHLLESYTTELLHESTKPLKEKSGATGKPWMVKLYDNTGAVCHFSERVVKEGRLVWNNGPIQKSCVSHMDADRWANMKLSENADSVYAEIMNIERGEVMRINRTDGNAKALKSKKTPYSKNMKPSTQKLWMSVGNTKVTFSNG